MSVTASSAPFDAHIARVSGYMCASVAVTAAAVWLTSRLTPANFQNDDAVPWLILIVAPLIVAVLMVRFAKPRSARGAQALLFAQSALIGLAFGMLFLPLAEASLARVFAVVAVSFGALGLWIVARRQAPSPIVMVLLMCVVGFGLATILLTALWPDGVAYLRFALGLGPTPPDMANSGGLEWILTVCCIIMFAAMNAGVILRARKSFVPPADRGAAARLAAQDALSLYAYFLLTLGVLWRVTVRRR